MGENSKALQDILDRFMLRKAPEINKAIGTPVSYFTDEQVIEHASTTNNEETNEKFKDLYAGKLEERYNSQSDADMALVSILCFWCGCVDGQIDRIFRTSGLMRDKWDRATSDRTYGAITIRNAILDYEKIYRPVREENADLAEFTNLDAEQIQNERDRRERDGHSFTPSLRYLDTSIESLLPYTNPRYESFQLGNTRMFVDYYKLIIPMNDTRVCW